MKRHKTQKTFLAVCMSTLLLGIFCYIPISPAEEKIPSPVKSKADIEERLGLTPSQPKRVAEEIYSSKGVAGTANINTIPDEKIAEVATDTTNINTIPDEKIAEVATDYVALSKLRKAEMTIHFEYDSDRITGEDSHKILDLCAEVLLEHLEVKTVVAGHTDSAGSSQYNLDLSRRRAESVKRYLSQQHKIDPGRLLVAAFGEEEPITINTTADGRTLNRRVELIRYQ